MTSPERTDREKAETPAIRRRAFADAAPDVPPADWKAAWIWTSERTAGVHDHVCFRRAFDLPERPAGTAWLRIAAERDAAVWVNGRLIGYGPPVSDPRFKRYDTYDVAADLREGRNVIAVRVYHDATRCGALTSHAQARGLLCQLEADGVPVLVSDETWRVRRNHAYLEATTPMGDTLWPEIFDARKDTPGWTDVVFEDAAWPPAAPVIPPVHRLWGSEQPQARFYPWVNLVPSETRPLRRTQLQPAAILAAGEVLQRREASPHDAAVRMSLEPVLPLEKAEVAGAECLVSGAGPARIRNSPPDECDETFDGIRNATIVFDFGRLVNARFGMRLEAAGGSVDVGYAYRLEDGRVAPYVSRRTALADHYIARAGEQAWETADWRHFRYVQLTFRDLPGPLVLHEVWAEAVDNGFETRGRFSCSDPAPGRLFEIVRRTTDLCVVDRTMDNPSRERRQYLGDCSSIVPAITSCFGDNALLRRYFRNAQEGQHATGLYRYSYPGHEDDGPSLFDHSLSLPIRLWEHYALFADTALVRELWPGVERFLGLLASGLDRNGCLALPPYGIWFDWGHMERRGLFLPLQAMGAEALRSGAWLAEAADADGCAWEAAAARMIAHIPDWYDPERGVFVDAIVDGQRQTHASEHALSLLAFWGLAPDAMIQAALDRWAAAPGSFGRASPAWHYLPGALLRAGRTDLALRWMRERMDRLDRQGLDTWPETWCLYGEKTVGAWRCRNSRAVAQGAGLGGVAEALVADLCGIQPGEPGFASVYLCPRPGSLAHMKGVRPGPDGDYALTLDQTRDGWRLRLELPSPRRVVLDAAFAPEARTAQVDGQRTAACETRVLPGGVKVGRFCWEAGEASVIEVGCT